MPHRARFASARTANARDDERPRVIAGVLSCRVDGGPVQTTPYRIELVGCGVRFVYGEAGETVEQFSDDPAIIAFVTDRLLPSLELARR